MNNKWWEWSDWIVRAPQHCVTSLPDNIYCWNIIHKFCTYLQNFLSMWRALKSFTFSFAAAHLHWHCVVKAIVKAAISISTSSNNNEEPWRVFASVCGNFWDFLIFLSASEQSQMFPRNNMKYCLLFGAKSAKFLGFEIISFPRLLFSHWFVVTVVTASEKWKNLIVTSVHSDSMWFCYHFTKCSTPMSRIEWSGFLYCWPKTQHIIINCSWKIGNFGMLIRVIC